MRTGIYKLTLSVSFVLLAVALCFVQVVRGRYYHALSQSNSIRLIPEEPCRGKILDRYRHAMADSIISFDVIALPQELRDRKNAFERVARMLNVSVSSLEALYERGYLNPVTPVVLAKGVPKATAIAVEEEALDLPGVRAVSNPRRYYPFGTSASHVLGYIGEIDRSRITRLKEYGYDLKDLIGYSGLEERLDMRLRGEKGGQQVEVDSRGRQARLLGYKPPSFGSDVVTTIDLEIQQIAEHDLAGQKGAVVILDVAEGEVLVMISSPAFDPNVFAERKERQALNRYLMSEQAPLFNRAISGQFPPGSVFKVVTALSALRVKRFPPSMTYVCNGGLRIGGRVFKCWSTHGPQDFYQAVAHSCDVYFYHLGLTAGADMMRETAHDFGLGSPTGVDLSHEAAGFVPGRIWKRLSRLDNWYDGDTANFSIGQGYMLTTPIQLARMMAAVANGGYLVTPHLTKFIAGEETAQKERRRINIPPEDLIFLRDALRYPVSFPSGTAHDLDMKGLEVCAKTGTAQIAGGVSHGWVAGFFPKENPKYAFCVLLENAGTSHQACVLARKVFEEAVLRKKLP